MRKPLESTIVRVTSGLWYWPDGARRAHFFDEDGASLCRRYEADFYVIHRYSGTADDSGATAEPTVHDCAKCRTVIDTVLDWLEDQE